MAPQIPEEPQSFKRTWDKVSEAGLVADVLRKYAENTAAKRKKTLAKFQLHGRSSPRIQIR